MHGQPLDPPEPEFAGMRVPALPFGRTPPPATDVGIVGGGIVGVATALHLARRGHSVAVLEKGYVGAEQSSRALGWIRVTRRDPRDIPLALESRLQWQRITSETGNATGYRQSGLLYLSESAADLAAHENWLKRAQGFGVDARLVTPQEVDQLIAHRSTKVVGGLYSPGDGCIELPAAAPVVATLASAAGAQILTRCAVRGIETQAGAVSGLVTERGFIRCSTVIVAGGVWSAKLLGALRIPLPQLAIRSFVMRTDPVAGPEVAAARNGLGLRRTVQGAFYVASQRAISDLTPAHLRWFRAFQPALKAQSRGIALRLGAGFLRSVCAPNRWPLDKPSPFEAARMLSGGRSPWSAAVWRDAQALYPFLEGARVIEEWSGTIDVTPDSLPVISGVDRVRGLYVATGFSGGGLGTSLGAGMLAADLATGMRPNIDPHPYRYNRFFDGSPIEPAH